MVLRKQTNKQKHAENMDHLVKFVDSATGIQSKANTTVFNIIVQPGTLVIEW